MTSFPINWWRKPVAICSRCSRRSTSSRSCSANRTTKLGAVETWQHAQACADLFRKHRDRIEGVLVCLPNFGDEKGVADVLRCRR